MTAVTVTIGRNVSAPDRYGDLGRPLPRSEWLAFVAAVDGTVRARSVDVWVDTPYLGEWNGQREEAHLWLAQLADDVDLGALRADLASLAAQYRQEAVGLVLGEPALIAATDALDVERELTGVPA